MESFMGTMQWYDLLCRYKLSCYHHVYQFARDPTGNPMVVSQFILTELLCSVCLTSWWQVAIDKPYLESIVATDASTKFGFGGTVGYFPPNTVHAIGCRCNRQGASVTLDESEKQDSTTDVRRFRLAGMRRVFKTVFSIRSKRKAHINTLEAKAFTLGLHWLLRRPHRHNARVVFMLDSKVVIGAASKGRTSAGGLQHEIKRSAALVMAGMLHTHLVYIATSENPADAPSRGVHKKSTLPKSLRRLQHRLALAQRARQRLADMQQLGIH